MKDQINTDYIEPAETEQEQYDLDFVSSDVVEIDFLNIQDEFELSKAAIKIKKNSFFVKLEKKF